MTKEKLPLSPLNDLVFKRIFTHIPVLKDFLAAVLNVPGDFFTGLTVTDPLLLPETAGGKLSVLDVKARAASGAVFDIEIQVFRVSAMRARMLFYNMKLFTQQLQAGDRFGELKPAVSIIISDDSFISEEQDCHNEYRILNVKSHRVFTNLFDLHTLELSKLGNGEMSQGLKDWLKFLKARTKEDYMEAARGNPAIGAARDVLFEISADERARLEAEARQKAIWDYNSAHDWEGFREEGREEGIMIGREEGIAIGVDRGREEVLELVRQGYSAEQIGRLYSK